MVTQTPEQLTPLAEDAAELGCTREVALRKRLRQRRAVLIAGRWFVKASDSRDASEPTVHTEMRRRSA